MAADNELTREEISALAEAFPVGAPARTLLRMAQFPPAAIPPDHGLSTLEFWTEVGVRVAGGALPDGRRKLLAAARRKYPYSTKLAAPAAGASAPVVPAAPLRVLVIGASPDDPDLPHVRADRESHVIGKVAVPGRLEVEAVLGAEATDLAKVGEFRPDIVHFVCHGEGEFLVFSDTRGEADFVTATRVADMLDYYRETSGVRLRGIVLAACEGNTLAPFFTGVGDTVIAHRGKLDDQCGVAFAEQLYRRLNDAADLAAAAREAAQLTAQFSASCLPVTSSLIVLPDGR